MNDIIRLLTQQRISPINPLMRNWLTAVLADPTTYLPQALNYFPVSPLSTLERYYVRQMVDAMNAGDDVYTLLIHLPLDIYSELARNYLRNIIADVALTYSQKVLTIAPGSLVGYWRLNESSGTTALDSSGNGYNGTYAGATLGQPGIGDGETAAVFDGAGIVTLYGSSLDSLFPRNEGTLLAWAKVEAAGTWTDGADRTVFRAGTTSNTSTMTLFVRKSSTNNTLRVQRSSNGVTREWNLPHTQTGWMCLIFTWSFSHDRQRFYFNGVQEDSTLTGLASGAGKSLNSQINIAAASSGSQRWDGSLAHIALWGTELSAAQAAELAQIA